MLAVGIAFVVVAWFIFRLAGEVYARRSAQVWFGSPEPSSMRLFGGGVARPIQSFRSLETPSLEYLTNEFGNRRAGQDTVRNHRLEWAALADGLVLGSSAYAATVAASAEASQALSSMPSAFEHVAIGGVGASDLTAAQQAGYQSWIEGHIGESVAANFLAEHGHNVTFAAAQNQPGWDLLVDGVQVQVKVGADAGANVAEHLDRYPGIPVVTDPDTAAAFHSPMVQGIPSLDHGHVHSLALEQAGHVHAVGDAGGCKLDSLHHAHGVEQAGGFDPGLHIPWITIGLGAFREISLAETYGGSFLESLGSIAVDAASVAIGAKGGALAGAILGPLGMVVGSVVGALVGRAAVGSLRRSGVEEEAAELKSELEEVDHKFAASVRKFERDATAVVNRWNLKLRDRTQPARTAYTETIAELTRAHDEATLEFCRRVHRTFEEFDQALESDLRDVYRRFPVRPMWRRVLLPSASDTIQVLAEDWIRAKRTELLAWRARFAAIAACEELDGAADVDRARGLLQEFTSAYKIWDSSAQPALRATADEFQRIREEADAAFKVAAQAILAELESVERQARDELNRLWDGHEAALAELAEALDPKVQALARKAARARHTSGFAPPSQFVAQCSASVREGITQNTSGAATLRAAPAFA